ncbi:PREDICTED: telomeric repeat-binding factor 2 [Nanorana parkeri]|uniref:telomeric repeat-binding factor 2 n=1 Tax=Nanorana parkeri TaxID=125878 RepID=UPI000854BE89|nr:PREDICTED: telomeric repeat-binding factor 2 [Nanorana parkeri]
MAAPEDSDAWALEPVVNQWVLDYFFHLAVLAFRSSRHDDFAELRDIVSVLIQRPFKFMEKNTQVLRILQCLSRIEEGDDPDCAFDQDSSETPLESAVEVLNMVKNEMTLDKDVIESNMQMLKESAVVACIKKKQFSKASNILKKYISSGNETKKLRAELQYIISKKNCNHPMIASFSLSTIKQKAYKMFEESIKQTPCFLMTLAQKDNPEINAKPAEPSVSEAEARHDVEEPPTKDIPSSSDMDLANPRQEKDLQTPTEVRSEIDRGPVYSLSAIKSTWRSLCEDRDPEAKFRELCDSSFCKQASTTQTVSVETPNSKRPPACTPREDLPSSGEPGQLGPSPAISLHQLVMEPDSQQDNEIEEERPSKASTPEEKSANSTVRRLFNSPPVNKKRKHNASNKSNTEEQDTWSEEDELFRARNQKAAKADNTTTNGIRKQKWTVEETEWIKLGVKEVGEGNWAKILKRFPFHNRTSVMIKDRWRTMKKLSLV